MAKNVTKTKSRTTIKRSQWRELKTVEYGLHVFSHGISDISIDWYSDSYAAGIIVNKGSPIRELQKLANGIYKLSHTLNTELKIHLSLSRYLGL